MQNKKQQKTAPPKFKDISRYTRWVARLDQQDERLSPAKRRRKWLLLFGISLLSFALSFVFFPSVRLDHEVLSSPALTMEQAESKYPATHPFEMPADSFENLLKRKIDERVFEEK
ncbi:hypothetical protein [Sunxiuqinia indica]|uniref:hypothetical protein n=1 Tax=Sunxiuqinia indica TaxID=2692584 RepID=UPI00135C238E|nr:hypothetical protein [Sunxiuqinia indica]